MWDPRPRICWRRSQGAGETQSKEMSGWTLVCDILYVTALSMLSLYAVCLMGDQFGLPLESGWPAGLWAAAGWILAIVAWNEGMYAWRKRAARLAGNAALFAAAYWGPDLYLALHETQAQQWSQGIADLWKRYGGLWDRYFGVSGGASQWDASVTLAQQQWAWVALWAMLAMLLQVFSGYLRKRTMMLLLPAAALTAGMLVGVTPKWPGIACMFAAGLLSLYLDRHREFRAVPALTLAGFLAVLLPLTGLVMEGPASRINQSHDRLQAFQHQVEQEIREYDWETLLRRQQNGRVDNSRPEFDGKEVLTVTVTELPDENLYLRGYCGSEYQNGRWTAGDREFARACRREGLDSGDAALLLAALGSPSRMEGDRMRYALRYTGTQDRSAYLPYGADLESIQETCRVSGDYVVERARSLKTLAFEGCAPGELTFYDRETWNSDAQEFYLWYNGYVEEQYLVVSGDPQELTDIVNEIRGSETYQSIVSRSQESADGRSSVRLALGDLVAGELRSLARYDIDPGPLPRGTDPVAYFLGENRRGYCMHFASAGALILRRLGVPARFVSGYVVQPDQFMHSAGGYRASVKDDAAHAWVEIWLENAGWVPVEMTPGYVGAEPLLTEQPATQQATPAPSPFPATPPESPPSPTAGEPDADAAPHPTAAPQSPSQESDAGPGMSAAGTQQTQEEGWGFAGEGGWAAFGQNGNLRVGDAALIALGIMAAAALLWLAALWLPRLREARWQRLWREIECGGTRRAVQIINRRLYRKLRKKRAGLLLLRSDEEYLAALKRQYPGEDWENYLAVVRKAVYSREEISVKEAGNCYELLRKC